MNKLKLFLIGLIEPNDKKNNTFLNILILTIGATLSWIYFIYFTHWISILYSSRVSTPQLPEGLLPSATWVFRPEPLEMPFYGTGWIFIPFFTIINYIVLKLFFNKVQSEAWDKIQNLRKFDFTKYLVLTLSILIAGTFISLSNGKNINFSSIGNIKGLNLTLTIAVAVFLFPLLKLKVNKWVKLGLEVIISIAIVFILLFDPTFSFNTHHYNFYLGPVNDVLHGRSMMVDTSCQYGLLVVYFLSFLFTHFLPFTYKAFAFFIFLLYFVYYVGLYFCFRYWTRSYLLALVGMFLILLFNYFSQVHYCLTDPFSSTDIGPFSYPSIGPLRFGMFFIIFVLFLAKNKYTEHPATTVIDYFILFFSAFSLFWGFEVGVYIILAVFSAYIISYLIETNFAYRDTRNNFIHFLIEIVLKFLILIVTIVLISGIISLFTYIRSGQMPNWQLFYGNALLYKSGLMMLPMPSVGPYYLVLVIYFIAIIYLFINILFKHQIKDVKVVSFITFFGILQFVYYLGRSHPVNLYHVCIPAIMLLVWFISKIKECNINCKLSSDSGRLNYIFLILIISSISTFSALELHKDWQSIISHYVRKYNFIKENKAGIMKLGETDEAILEKAKLIKEFAPDETKVALIAGDNDTRVLINAGKTNLMEFFSISEITTWGRVKESANIVNKAKPDYLFLEDSPYSRNFPEYIDLTDYLILGEKAGLIVLKNKNCKKIEPTNWSFRRKEEILQFVPHSGANNLNPSLLTDSLLNKQNQNKDTVENRK